MLLGEFNKCPPVLMQCNDYSKEKLCLFFFSSTIPSLIKNDPTKICDSDSQNFSRWVFKTKCKSCSLITFEGRVMAAAVSPGFIQC